MVTANDLQYDPFVHTMHPDPYPIYRQLRDHAPVYYNPRRHFFALSQFADVQMAARDWKTFSNSASVDLDDMGSLVGPGNFLDSDPPLHDRLRNYVRRYFAPRLIAQLEPAVRDETVRLFHNLPHDREIDIADALCWPLPVNVVSHVLGMPPSDWEHVQRALATFSLRGVERPAEDVQLPAEAAAAAHELRAYLHELMRDRPATLTPGIIKDLGAQAHDGDLTMEEAVGICFLLYLAGTDTTSSLMANAISVLHDCPEQRDLLTRAVIPIEDAVEEILRFDAPIQVTARITMRDATVQDTTLPQGSRVVLIWGSAAHDERRFGDPDILDITRKPQRHLGFGEGIHHCLGAPLARLETRVLLEELLRRAPRYAVTRDAKRLASHTTRGIVSLPAVLQP